MAVIVSTGSRGPRVRIPGMKWQSIRTAELDRYLTKEGRRAMAAVEKAVRSARYRRLPELRRRRPYFRHTSIVLSRYDIIRVWSDEYYRIPEDYTHGFVRIAAYMESETSVAVTFWCKPRGSGWIPMFGRIIGEECDRMPTEVGWIYDMDDTEDVSDISQ